MTITVTRPSSRHIDPVLALIDKALAEYERECAIRTTRKS